MSRKMFDPVKDAIENSPIAQTQPLPPTPSFKHNILAPPSPPRRNSVSMLLNEAPRPRTASLAHLLSPTPYAPRRISAGSRVRVPLSPDEPLESRNPLRSAPPHENRKRKRPADDAGETRLKPDRTEDASVVAQHYNQRREVGVRARGDSPIIGLRNLNNWIKSVLIAKFGRAPLQESTTRRGRTSGKVLDIGCGKGGDLRKWFKANIAEYVGLDIADVSIAQARERWREITSNQRFDAEFHAFNCFAGPISDVVSPARLRTPFDVVSMQFCMHYAFESLNTVRTMLQNVSQYLRPGGVFLGTIPNSNLLLSKLDQLPGDELAFGNSVYSVRFDSKREQPLYGHRYWFFLRDAVEDVPEFVVRWEEFKALSLEYGLKAIYRSEFHDIYALERRDPDHGPLLQRMKVVNQRGDIEMTEDQWQAANIYIAFAFEKQ